MNRRPIVARVRMLAAVVTLGFMTAAPADIVTNDFFGATIKGTHVFHDTLATGPTSGTTAGLALSLGRHVFDIVSASVRVVAMIPGIGTQGRVNAAQAALPLDDAISTTGVDNCVSGVSLICGSTIGMPCRGCLTPDRESIRREFERSWPG